MSYNDISWHQMEGRMTGQEFLKKIKAELACSDHKTLVIWASDCAERVLPYFEEKSPHDDRPRQAIEAGRAWVRGGIKITGVRSAAFAAHAAAREAGHESARNAARAAGHASATAHVAGHAVHAAAYAAGAVGLATGPDSAAAERDWQYRHIFDLQNDIEES